MSLTAVARALDRIVGAVGQTVSWLALAMVLTDVLVVVLRYGFDTVFIWMQELTTYFHAAVFLVGAVYIVAEDGHVRVSILYDRFPETIQTCVDIVTMLGIVVPLAILLHWTSIDYVMNSWSMREGSSHSGGLPAIFVLKTYIWVFADLLALAALARALHCMARLLGRSHDGAESRPGNTEAGV